MAALWRTLRVTVGAGVDDMRDQGADGAALRHSLRRRAGPRRVGHHHPSHLKPALAPLCGSLCGSSLQLTTLQLTPWLLYNQSSMNRFNEPRFSEQLQ